MTPLYIVTALCFIQLVVNADPYIIFLNSSSVPNTAHQPVYSIGDFHWYMDHLDDNQAEQLTFSGHVLHKDETVFYTSEQIQTDLPSWGLDRIDQREGGDDQFHFPSTAGEGVDIYLIDTGVNVDHVDFEGRARHGPTFTADKDPEDTNGHGSFVAGVCCGKIYGVAKKANVISVKALDNGGSGRLGNILQALHWIVKRHLKTPDAKSIVNLSLAADYHLPTNEAIEQAVKLGIHFSIAAGNQGQDACDYSPASTKNALVVGALNPDDSVASYSNIGSCVDIYAPGTAITSVWNHHKKDIHVLSGTSMAAPHVAGVMAILLSENDYTPSELIEKVKDTATLALSSRAGDNDIAYQIAQLTGASYNDSSLIKVLYMEPSLFAKSSLTSFSLRNCSWMKHLTNILVTILVLMYL